MTQRHILCAVLAAAAAGFATQSFAADLPSHSAPPVFVPPPAVASWTGYYVGATVGYGFGGGNGVRTNADPIFSAPTWNTELAASTALATGTANGSSDGFIGGLQAGYNYQFSTAALAGIETDLSGSTIGGGGSFSGSAVPTAFPNELITSSVSSSKHVNYFGTLRGRLGFLATPALLLYGTGGLAYGGVSAHTTIQQNNLPFADGAFSSSGGTTRLKVGYAVGAGAEYKITPAISAKVEYLYYDLGHVGYAMPTLQYVGNYASAPRGSAHFNGNLVRLGLNYHFADTLAPVVARY